MSKDVNYMPQRAQVVLNLLMGVSYVTHTHTKDIYTSKSNDVLVTRQKLKPCIHDIAYHMK